VGPPLQVVRCLVDHGCSLIKKDLSDRRASEMLPSAAAAEGAWLAEMTREAVKQKKGRQP
jgi:hypothetical protein